MASAKAQSPLQQRLQKRYSSHSPSRQLQFDLEVALEQLIIHDHEVSRVHAYQRRTVREELEARDSARTKAHTAAIDAAKAKHEAVREEAEAVLRHHLKEQEEERRRKAEEDRQRQEREAREKAERERKAKEERDQAERKAKEERDRQESEARKAAEAKAKAEADAAAQKQKAEQERLEKERISNEAAATEAAASKAKADKEAADRKALQQQQDQQAAKAKTAAVASANGFYSASPEAEAHHNEYLALHKKLKQFRKDFWDQAKKDKQLKAVVGDMRRAMRTSVGQLTDDKVGNRQATDRVKQAITQSLSTIASPQMPINDFLPPHLHLPNTPETPCPQLSSLTAYLLSIFSKAIIAAFTNEVAVNPRAAEPIGTLAAQVFSLSDLQFTNPLLPQNYQSQSLIPILLSKYHLIAPPLFGVSGPESTPQGRARLGWRIESNAPVTEQRHHERMTGLGAGYSSIALRNFSKTKLRNPYPPRHFWTSLAYLCNTPPEAVTTSHLLLLKAMLDNNAIDRFVLFFGDCGVAAIREAVVGVPSRLPEGMKNGAAARSIQLMVEGWGREKMFHLE